MHDTLTCLQSVKISFLSISKNKCVRHHFSPTCLSFSKILLISSSSDYRIASIGCVSSLQQNSFRAHTCFLKAHGLRLSLSHAHCFSTSCTDSLFGRENRQKSRSLRTLPSLGHLQFHHQLQALVLFLPS